MFESPVFDLRLAARALGRTQGFTTAAVLRRAFGIEPGNPATLVPVAMLFLAVAAAASYVPARRATRVDPPWRCVPSDNVLHT